MRASCVNHVVFEQGCHDCNAADQGVPSYGCVKCQHITYDPDEIAALYCRVCKITADEWRNELMTKLTGISPSDSPMRRDGWTDALLTVLFALTYVAFWLPLGLVAYLRGRRRRKR